MAKAKKAERGTKRLGRPPMDPEEKAAKGKYRY